MERLKRDDRFATSPSPGDANRVLEDEDLTSSPQTQPPPTHAEPETPPTTESSVSHSESPAPRSGVDATLRDRSHSLGSTPLKSPPVMGLSELLQSMDEVFGHEEDSSEGKDSFLCVHNIVCVFVPLK